MAGKRIELSFSIFQSLLIFTCGILLFVATFTAGVIVGREKTEFPLLGKEVPSQVVKMKIDTPPPTQPQPESISSAVEPKGGRAFQNITAKPEITFYETLSNPGKEEPRITPVKTDTGKREKVAPEREKPEKKTSSRVYTLQVGAMKDRKTAEQMSAKLRKNGYSVSIMELGRGSDTLYRVRVGSFTSREAALKEASKIKKTDGLGSMVVQK